MKNALKWIAILFVFVGLGAGTVAIVKNLSNDSIVDTSNSSTAKGSTDDSGRDDDDIEVDNNVSIEPDSNHIQF